jgi:hypothetical protein
VRRPHLVIPATQASLTVNLKNVTVLSFEAVPIQVGSNSIVFDDVSGELIMENSTLSKMGKIILHRFRGHKRPFDEEMLLVYQDAFQPKAVIMFGGSNADLSFSVIFPTLNVSER